MKQDATVSRMFRFIALVAITSTGLCAQQMLKAELGNLKLQNGETIQNCTLAYRTYGTLNGDRSNAVLFPSWFAGSSRDLAAQIGPGKLLDSGRYFVIAVDALGNGVTISPSNSPVQPRMRFPKFSIRDMVESQRLLVTGTLGIQHLRAVVGVSMGGMQAFEWAVAYPGMMDFAIPIVGSPRPTSYDLLLWTAELHAIENDPSWEAGDYSETPDAMRTVAAIHALALETPDYWVEHTPRQRFDDALRGIEGRNSNSFDANNWVRQVQAVIGHDVTRNFGGDMAKAAMAVKARMLIVTSRQDHMVNPHPATEFAQLQGAKLLELDDNAGHSAPAHNERRIGEAVAALLDSGSIGGGQ